MKNRVIASLVLLCIPVLLFVLGVSCSSGETSANDYFDPLEKAASKYNLARDDVDEVIQLIDYAPPPADVDAFLTRRVAILETAISEMNAASDSLGQQTPPSKFEAHQSATLKAWRAGIEATVAIRLYVLNFLETGQDDFSLIVQANKLFGEEDQYQIEARRAMASLRCSRVVRSWC